MSQMQAMVPMLEDAKAPDGRLSLLKLLASLAVVVVHTSMARVSVMDVDALAWWWANVADAAGHLGSATFAMVAGAVLLGRPLEQAPWHFIQGRMQRLLPPLLFWSALYFAWRAWQGQALDSYQIARDLLLGMPMYHLWFFFMMLAMYWVLPTLRFAVLGLERQAQPARAWWYVLVVLAVMTWLVSSVQAVQQVAYSNFLELVPLFVVYFLAGYYLLRHPIALPSWLLCLAGGLCVGGMALGVGLTYSWLQEWALVLFYSNRGPLAMVLTCSVFVLLLRVPQAWIPRWVNRLAKVTLGVYAMHPLVMGLLAHGGWNLDTTEGYAWMVQAVAVYVLSMAASLLLYAMPGLQRLVR